MFGEVAERYVGQINYLFGMLLVTLILSNSIPIEKTFFPLKQQNTKIYGSERTNFRFVSFYAAIKVSVSLCVQF